MPGLSKTIGRYVIDRTLGQGAMGVVYLAEDPLLKRRVAVKVVRAVGDERNHALARFRREAEISAQLNHPNIVTIFDVGEEPGLGPFLTMEYVEGSSLGTYIRDGALGLETRFSILIQTMRALRAAHRHAIVHRDVKPDNILVTDDGRVKLMDFGIAKTMAPQMTQAGEFLGSPAYSAPELLRGSDPTPSSDRFAFAVTAFELLTGRLPHPGNTVAAVITHVLMEPPVIPPGMSGDMAKVFRQALALDPDERPGTLMDFLVPLLEAQPLDPATRDRINEMFRHDDYAGDIVPLRRLRPPSGGHSGQRPGTGETDPAGSGALGVDTAGRSSAGRSTSGRSTAGRSTAGRATFGRPAPSYSQPPAVKIELQDAGPRGPLRPPPQRRPQRNQEAFLTPMKLIKWFFIVLVLGQAFWWVYRHFQS